MSRRFTFMLPVVFLLAGSDATPGDKIPVGRPVPGANLGRAHMEGIALFREKRYAEAAQRFHFERLDNPGNARAVFFLALCTQHLDQWQKAEQLWQEYLLLDSDDPTAAYIRRQMAFCRKQSGGQADDNPRRKKPVWLNLSEQELDALGRSSSEQADYAVVSRPHCLVRARNEKLATLVADETEAVLKQINATLLNGRAFPHVIEVTVWRSRQAFRDNAGAPHWSGGGFSFQPARGSSPAQARIDLIQKTDDGRFDRDLLPRALPHELCHVVLAEFFGQKTCPLWLQEGLAVLAEYDRGRSRDKLVREYVKLGNTIPFRRLFTARTYDKEQLSLFYAQSACVARFLFDQLSSRQSLEFLEHIRSGQSVRIAIERPLCLKPLPGRIQRLEQSWRQHLFSQFNLTCYPRAPTGG